MRVRSRVERRRRPRCRKAGRERRDRGDARVPKNRFYVPSVHSVPTVQKSQLLGLEKTDAFGRRAHGRQPRWKTANVCPRSSERALLGAKPNFNLRHVAVGGRPHAERQALSIGAATAPGTSPFCKSSLAKGNAAAPAIWTRAPLRAAKSGNSGSTIFRRRERAQRDGRRGVAGFDQQQIRCAAGAGEPGRERIGGRVPRGGNFGRGERHRRRQPDRDAAGGERGRDFSARGGEDEAIRMSRREARRSAPSQRARGDAPRHRQTWF